MAWEPKAGRKVRYINAAGRGFHAVIVTVTSPTVVDLRIGNGSGKTTIAAAAKIARHTDGAAGWHRP